MARKFHFVKAWTGPSLADKLESKYASLKREPIVTSIIATTYCTTTIGDRIEYSAMIEYENTEF